MTDFEECWHIFRSDNYRFSNVGSQNTCQGHNKSIFDIRLEGSILRSPLYERTNFTRAWRYKSVLAFLAFMELWDSSEIMLRPNVDREIWNESTSILEERSRQRLQRVLTKRVARQPLKRNTCAEKGNVKYSRHAYVKTRSPDHFSLPLNFLNCVSQTFRTWRKSKILGIS